MAAPYKGQSFNLPIEPTIASPWDTRTVQLTEAEMKTPATWLRDGIYCLGKAMIITTFDDKAFQYIGRSGNATDIADDTKWKRLAYLDDIASQITELTNPFQYQGNISEIPSTSSVGYVYRASTAITLPAAKSASGNAEELEAGDMLICVASGKFSVLQNNVDLEGVVHAPNVTDKGGYVPMFTSPNGTTVGSSGVTGTELVNIKKEFAGTQQTTMPSTPAAGTLADMIKQFRNNGNSLATQYELPEASSSELGGIKLGFEAQNDAKEYPVQLDGNGKAYVSVPWTDTQSGVATESAAGLMTASEKKYLNATTAEIPTADENTFIAAIVALFAKVGTKAFSVRLSISAGMANNFFGFVASAPHVIAQVDIVSATAFKMHFKNYSLDGTSSSAYVPYTYDSSNKVLLYPEYMEAVVS